MFWIGLLVSFFIALLQFFTFWQSLYLIIIPIIISLIFIFIIAMSSYIDDKEGFTKFNDFITSIISIIFIILVFNNINTYATDIKKYIIKENKNSYIIKFNKDFCEIKKRKNYKFLLQVYEIKNLKIKNFKVINVIDNNNTN